mmetsp:Transcript_66263/g.107477  ORF Transcript_66263/g.107477 Transcript_66263/m.107477 type:complete len:85 (+) Transcript_66263:377-631(+)
MSTCRIPAPCSRSVHEHSEEDPQEGTRTAPASALECTGWDREGTEDSGVVPCGHRQYGDGGQQRREAASSLNYVLARTLTERVV